MVRGAEQPGSNTTMIAKSDANVNHSTLKSVKYIKNVLTCRYIYENIVVGEISTWHSKGS
jgi:hypothetical protein